MDLIAQRELNTFFLPQHVRFKLHSNGFTTTEDLQNMSPEELSKETQLTEEEATETLQLIFKRNVNHDMTAIKFMSAADLLKLEKSKPAIPTFCQELDSMLGGGIPLRMMTEFCGEPGSGKTQMCYQLCSNVQIPECCGGLDGEALFLDAEGSFIIERLSQIVDATVETCRKIMRGINPSFSKVPFDSVSILERIHYFHCLSYEDLIARITVLPEFLEKNPKIKLIVIDSISFHFRYGFGDSYSTRTKILAGAGQTLVKIANDFELAVVMTNHMTSRIQDNEDTYSVVPALGESWGHVCAVRVLLQSEKEKKNAVLVKSPWMKNARTSFKITSNGVRDCQSLLPKSEKVPEPKAHASYSGLDSSIHQDQPMKKLKLSV